MNYIDFLKDLAPFIDKGIGDYLLNVSIALLAISSVAMLYFCYAEFKSFKKTKESTYFSQSVTSGVIGVFCCTLFCMMVISPINDIPKLKEVKIDNKENVEFYKAIIRSPYYQKMNKNDKFAVYASTFNGIVCDDKGCLDNNGEPLLAHKNYALTYAIKLALSAESIKLSKDFGRVITLSDVVYRGLNGLSYNGISYDYEKEFYKFLEKTPKADEAIENAKEVYKNLEATYGREWK